MKKNLKFFLLGATFGLIIFVSLFFIPSGKMNPLLEKVFVVAYFPGGIINPTDSILHWFCNLFQSNACRGLGFDGGPLVWVEWTFITIAMAIWYGFIFLLGAKLIEWYKKRKKSRQL
jgi:hypothetical protein